MSPTGAWYLLTHPDRPEEPQIVQAMSAKDAANLTVLPSDHNLEIIKCSERPDTLTITAHLEGDIGLVDKAVECWPETDPSKKNTQRALACFKNAFGRSYRKFEARALSDIVRRAKDLYGEPIPPVEKEVIDDTEEEREDETVRGERPQEDTGGRGDPGIRLGRVSWTDKVRAEPEAKRPKAMEALGDPRDPDVPRKKAGLGSRRIS